MKETDPKIEHVSKRRTQTTGCMFEGFEPGNSNIMCIYIDESQYVQEYKTCRRFWMFSTVRSGGFCNLF